MLSYLRKGLFALVAVLVVLTLSACDLGGDEPDPDPNPDPDPIVNVAPVITGAADFAVAFGQSADFLDGVTASDEEDGDLTASITVDDGGFDADVAGEYIITYTVEDSGGLTGTATITVTVNEEEGPSAEEMIAADIAYYQENQMVNPDRVNLFTRGGVHQTVIEWTVDHPNILSSGLILPLERGSEPVVVTYTGLFQSGDVEVEETFEVTLQPLTDVVLSESRDVPFTNLTTEYDVADGSLTLHFEENGSVPYVDVESFFGILDGFIDPAYDISFTGDGDTLTLFYQYYDEDEDHTYDLEVVIDATANTITTNDMGFYWAYVYSTETNYGRHIEYVESLDEHYYDGEAVVFELDLYHLDIVQNDNGIFLPYYLVNQIFAGSSYYNVYYNGDGLFGIYSLPESSSEEYQTIHTSSANGTGVPSDLLIHNYDMLAFNLDYFYGLKDYYEIDTFYDVLANYQSGLLSHSARTFDETLRDLLLQGIDEPHTSYGYPSYFNATSYPGPATNALRYYGSRVNAFYNSLFDVDDAIAAKWGESTDGSWNAYSGNRPYYWFLNAEKTAAVITLDNFYTSDITESATFQWADVNDVLEVTDAATLLPAVSTGSKFFYFNSSTDENRIFELLVKDVDASYLATYQGLLEGMGYTLVVDAENDDEDKANGYYHMTIGDKTYMVQVNYDADYELFYLGIADLVPETYEDDWPFTADVLATMEADTAIYLEMVLDEMKEEAPNVVDVVLDITWNTGGNVGALYRVVGFITDQPFRVSSMNAGTGGASSSYVQIVGVPYDASLNWALLTSGASFSAANSLATIFTENDLGPVIGLQTGGGTSSITPVLLPLGSAFTMSSNSMGALRTGDGSELDPFVYIPNEEGITPDIVISIDLIYDENTLLSAFQD
jgi:hypothetical protein